MSTVHGPATAQVLSGVLTAISKLGLIVTITRANEVVTRQDKTRQYLFALHFSLYYSNKKINKKNYISLLVGMFKL